MGMRRRRRVRALRAEGGAIPVRGPAQPPPSGTILLLWPACFALPVTCNAVCSPAVSSPLMKFLRHALAVSLLALLIVPAATAQEKPAAKPEKKQTELESKMEKLNAAWRKLRRQIEDPAQNAASLELLAEIRAASVGADQLTPAKAADLPEADRAKFQADYVAGMKKLSGMLDQLEAALKDNKNADAAKVVTDINNLQRESHKSFRRPPPEGKGGPRPEGEPKQKQN